MIRKRDFGGGNKGETAGSRLDHEDTCKMVYCTVLFLMWSLCNLHLVLFKYYSFIVFVWLYESSILLTTEW